MNGSLYSNRFLCQYLIMDIENGDGKEILKADNLTIEHIMPQTLSAEWNKSVTSEEHERYLHTLGNLTVTGYNSELSNKSFLEKKSIIKEHSKAVRLNEDVLDKDEWTAATIQMRGRRLAGIVSTRYAVEKVDDPSLEFEYVSHIALSDDFHIASKKKLVSFTFDGETYQSGKYILMLLDIVKLLDEKIPGKLEELASADFRFHGSNKKHSHISRCADKMRRPLEIKEGIYIETRIPSSTSIMHFIGSLMDAYNVDKSAFYISVVAEDSDNDEDAENDIEE